MTATGIRPRSETTMSCADAQRRTCAGLGGAFIVVELGKQALGVLDREHLADNVRPCVRIELGSRIPAEIVQRTWRRPLADEFGLGL